MMSVAFMGVGREEGVRIQLKTKKPFEFQHRFLETQSGGQSLKDRAFSDKHGTLERAKVSECQEKKKLGAWNRHWSCK